MLSVEEKYLLIDTFLHTKVSDAKSIINRLFHKSRYNKNNSNSYLKLLINYVRLVNYYCDNVINDNMDIHVIKYYNKFEGNMDVINMIMYATSKFRNDVDRYQNAIISNIVIHNNKTGVCIGLGFINYILDLNEYPF